MEKIGKYTIRGEIGKGGMGIVYRGSDPYIGRTVAIKTIRLDILSQESGREEALKRFLREAQAAGNLSHPNIVTIYDVGEHEGMIYIAMEHIDGCSLENLMQQGREFTLEEIGRMFGQIASALDYAHGQGIIHRDIKPANVLVGPDLKVSIVDFGIARTSASTMTQTGMLMGTPRYMSPEQIAGKKVDRRADIFSLGAILYELLTRHNPFEGESITTVIYKIMHAELPPLSDFNKHLPPGLERVVRKALARDPDQRYATCGELAADLMQCASQGSQADTIRDSAPGSQPTELLECVESTVLAAREGKPRRHFVLLAALFAVLAMVAAFIFLSGRRGAAPALPNAASSPAAADHEPGPDLAEKNLPPADAGKPSGRESEVPVAAAMTVEQPGGKPAGRPVEPKAQAAAEKPPAKDEAMGLPAQVQPEKTPAAPAPNRKGFLEGVFFNETVMVLIPQSYFTIGSPEGQGDPDEHPAHRVFISDFWLGKTEVTFAQFDVFCRDSGRPLPGDEGWGRGDRPVINVSWEDACSYCRWLAQKTGRRFRLPSEAEWEKAARERYPWGRSAPDSSRVNMKGSGDGFAFTAPAGSFPAGASPYGILDLAGNVWEWTADWYDPGYYQLSPGRDPRGPAAGMSRSVRGGSWTNGADLIRSANRSSENPDQRLNVLGFRVAMDSR
jgi:formylglycine-generating enzyme required for sulfatase activity/tRNA A-37 threonylcarbamoyl transferase component Bud32